MKRRESARRNASGAGGEISYQLSAISKAHGAGPAVARPMPCQLIAPIAISHRPHDGLRTTCKIKGGKPTLHMARSPSRSANAAAVSEWSLGDS